MPAWLRCAWNNCGWPGILKVEHVEGGSPITAFLCIWHILKARECISNMAEVARHDRELEASSVEVQHIERKEPA